MDSEKSVQYFIIVEVVMEKNYCTVQRDFVLSVNIHFNDDTIKELYDVVDFSVSVFLYPHYDFTLISGDHYRVPLSDIFSISISPISDGIFHLDLSDPLYRYLKCEGQSSLNPFESSEEEPF